MKKTTILLTAIFLTLSLLAAPRGAMSGSYDSIAGIKDAVKVDASGTPPEPPPDPCPNPFVNLQTIQGRIGTYTVSPVGSYVCNNGALDFAPRAVELIRFIRGPGEACMTPQAPVKIDVGGKTILILGVEPERFKATLAILNAAKLSNVNVYISAVPAPNCPSNTFYAAEVSLH